MPTIGNRQVALAPGAHVDIDIGQAGTGRISARLSALSSPVIPTTTKVQDLQISQHSPSQHSPSPSVLSNPVMPTKAQDQQTSQHSPPQSVLVSVPNLQQDFKGSFAMSMCRARR